MNDAFALIGARGALALHAALTMAVLAAAIGVASLLRERHAPAVAGAPDMPYESGVVPGTLPLAPLHAPYFLVAACFVIFDMQAAILFAWAVAARETGLGGLGAATIFIAVLLAALLYLWIDGALEFVPKASR